jgi:glutamyl-tRNA reductase
VAEALVDGEVAQFLDWQNARDVAPLVTALRARAEEIRRAELERLRKKMGPLTKEQDAALDAATSAIVNKLLHVPTVQLKEAAREGGAGEHVGLIRKLLGL